MALKLNKEEPEYTPDDTLYYITVEADEWYFRTSQDFGRPITPETFHTSKTFAIRPICQRGQVVVAVNEHEVCTLLDRWLE